LTVETDASGAEAKAGRRRPWSAATFRPRRRRLDDRGGFPVYAAVADFDIPFPVFVVDVGGTNARFALQTGARTRRRRSWG